MARNIVKSNIVAMAVNHDSANSYINNTTGQLCIGSDTIRLRSYDGNHDYVKGFVNGAVELYYDNSKKFETTSGGATVTNNLQVGGAGSAETDSRLYVANTHFCVLKT